LPSIRSTRSTCVAAPGATADIRVFALEALAALIELRQRGPLACESGAARELGRIAERATGLKKDVLRLNARIAGFEESANGVRARLSNGETLDANLRIGADGVKSTVRAVELA
jgi:2-polyprenyl-6-methoxyphenol hydroxylase-like FAD-dependent oxidoreductase